MPNSNSPEALRLPFTRIDYSAVRQALDALVLEGTSGAELRQQLAQVAENYRCNPRQVDQLYRALSDEHSQKVDIASAANGLAEIETIASAHLPIELGLYGDDGKLQRFQIPTYGHQKRRGA